MFDSRANATALLHSVFGFSAFRPGQEEIVRGRARWRERAGRHADRRGKSLCYQLPRMARPGLTLVVSPLIALMRDQVRRSRRGVAAGSLNSSNEPPRIAACWPAAPARAAPALCRARAAGAADTLEMLARATCADGDRRGALRLAMGPRLSARVPHARQRRAPDRRRAADHGADRDRPMRRPRGDIVDKLFDAPPRTFVRSFDRPNLRLAFKPKERSSRQVLTFVREHEGDSGIVYCASRRKVEELAEALRAAGVKSLPYHAGLDKRMRDANQDAFQQEDGVVMTATVAFGMGIDKPDVRFVCHADLPANVEAYYQEIGRAGRDGLAADTLTLYGLGDMQLRRLQIEQSDSSDERKRVERQRLNALLALAEAPRCRRQTPARLFRRTLRAVRQLRSLPGGRRALRRHDRGAEGDVGDPAHRRALRHGASGRHPDRRPHRERAEIQSRPPADLRRRQGPAECRMAFDLPPDLGARTDHPGYDGARALVRDRRRLAGVEGPTAYRAAQGPRRASQGSRREKRAAAAAVVATPTQLCSRPSRSSVPDSRRSRRCPHTWSLRPHV
jgi:hypothetical protein